MANDWFQFRQFLIRQDRTAMKVTTDGVLLGAWAGERPTTDDRRPMGTDDRRPTTHDFLSSIIGHRSSVNFLDVGTGTGLIALMLAQRFPEAMIDAVEIDHSAYEQACENIGLSPWRERIRVFEADFLKWESDRLYDLIVSNPPYFKDSLKSPQSGRSKARHDDTLPLETLIGKGSGLLNPEGSLALILPVEKLPVTALLAVQYQLNLNRILRVRGTPESVVKRVLIQLGKCYLPVEMDQLTIESGDSGRYSDQYQRITEEFYL